MDAVVRTGAEAFVDRMFNASVEMCDVLSVYIGDRLGLYRELKEAGAATPGDLAERAGIHPRYAREWLEQQAVTAILEVDDPSLPADERRYMLPASHAEALVDPDSPWSMAPLGRFLVSTAKVMPQILDAYRTGGGITWSQFGEDAVDSQGDFNRPWIMGQLGTEYLPSITDVHERLSSDPPARIADVACGYGWSAIAIAKAYPKVGVDGFDLDGPSIDAARRLADEHGVSDRVSFHLRDAADPELAGAYDLAIVIEAIHDLSRPVEVLSAIRKMLAPGASLIVADEKAAESFTAPGDAPERIFYGFSILSCLLTGMAEEPTAATGAVMRPGTLKAYATQAGFQGFEVLDQIEHDLLRFYRLTP